MKVFSSDKGFTIIETMVAIAILAVGTLGVGSMLMISFSSGRFATETRRAESLAMQRLEALKATQGTLAGLLLYGLHHCEPGNQMAGLIVCLQMGRVELPVVGQRTTNSGLTSA